jgi:aspartate/methionine/tyrosine aminotransferase
MQPTAYPCPELSACFSRQTGSTAFCARMLAEAGIAITPDVDSTTPVATGFLRFSYCGPENDMREAAARLKGWR